MHSSKNSEDNKKGNQIGLQKSHQKFDFGRCKICKDKASGIHYGIPSCEGCKVIIMKYFNRIIAFI